MIDVAFAGFAEILQRLILIRGNNLQNENMWKTFLHYCKNDFLKIFLFYTILRTIASHAKQINHIKQFTIRTGMMEITCKIWGRAQNLWKVF